jgi:hypothetical protein
MIESLKLAGVQDHGHMGRIAAHVLHQLFELGFGAVGREIGNLRLEGDDQVGRGVDDARAEVIDAARVALELPREFGWLRIEPHAEQRTVFLLCGGQLVEESHGA